jgi:outer membrane protein assembly factor BamB
MLTLWNASKCIIEGSLKHYFYIVPDMWRPPQGATIDWNDGYEWSVPIASDISGVPITPDLHITKISDGVILLSVQPDNYNAGALWYGSVPGGSQTGWQIEAGYSAVDGHLLWGPVNRTLTPWTTVFPSTAGEGVYIIYTLQEMTWSGYSIETGDKLWGPIALKNSSWGYYDYPFCNQIIGYGNLYSWGLGGDVYCLDVKTGKQKWSWNAGSAGFDTPYGTWPLSSFGQTALADGKLYVASGHDYTPPVYKGAKIYCLNATTGEEIWSSLSFNMLSGCAVTDGILVKHNGYDNQIHAYGKGPSKTTVTAPDVGVTLESSVMIKGTVMDISAGAEQDGVAERFPNGLPAVADECMSEWMEYVYQYQPCPEDVEGVEVTLKIQDPNGEWYQTTVTSDSNGRFSHMWSPSFVGEYHVTAEFEGSESYYASQETTAFGVDEAPQEAPSAEEIADTTASRMPAYPTTSEIADETIGKLPAYLTIDMVILIIAAVGVVIGIVAYMALKKQQ